MVLREAIHTYHDLLSDEMAAETQGHLDDQLRRRDLYFGERPLSTVLRPRFMTPDQYRFLQSRAQVVLRAFEKIHRAAVEDDRFRLQFGLTPWEEELVRHYPGYHEPTPVARLDAFYLPERRVLNFIENNAEVPAATAYNDVLSDVYLGLPVMRPFLRKFQVTPMPASHEVLHVLLGSYHQWGGRETPRIAIVDWCDVPTYSEFKLYEHYFHSQGVEARIVDPRDLEYRDGRLTAGDYHINLVYKRILISELVSRCGLDHALPRAVLGGAACMVNPFACKLLYKKSSLAVLSDERNQEMFTPDERWAIQTHIPWTRNVEQRRTEYHGLNVDLIPFVLQYRDRFVVKSNDDYGGKGVVLGWTVDDAEWERAVLAALETPHVVQEGVPLATEPYPSLRDGKVEVYERLMDTNPFSFFGEFVEGCLTRLSTEPLLNVTAGGGSTVPTFMVDSR
jgi:hypothetical protein